MVQIYGSYLSWYILSPGWTIDHTTPVFSWARMETIGDAIVVAINYGGLSVAGVGMLAVSTAALPLGLLAYHLYLIWAGMTTNESQKWSDYKEDMADGYVFQARKQDLRAHNRARQQEGAQPNGSFRNPALEDYYDERSNSGITFSDSDMVLVRTNDGKPPRGQEALWTRVWDLSSIDNIYDRGGTQNFLDVLRGR